MPHCPFNGNDHKEENMAFLEQLHVGGTDDALDHLIGTRQDTSIHMDNGEKILAMPEVTFGTCHDSSSKTEDNGFESYSDPNWDGEDSVISAARETHNDSGIGSDIENNDSDVTTPSSANTDDGYASDDSCASDDSFVTDIFGLTFFPTKRYYPPGYYPEKRTHIHKHPKDRPSNNIMQMAPISTSYSRPERLPAELRIQILMSMPNLKTLNSFIRASPIMHAQYAYDRHNILSTCLGRELDGFYADAYAHMKSRVSELGSLRTNECISDFLNSYQSWLAGPAFCPDVESLSPSRVRWMAVYHTSVAQPLVRRYGSWALGNLQKAALPPANSGATICSGRYVELSRSEEIRVFRALYRYDIYYHLFGYNLGFRCGYFSQRKINEIFFSIFEPWENEAAVCIDTFVRQQYDDVFNKIRDDFHPSNVKFRHCSLGSIDFDREHDDYMDGTIQRGLKTLARTLTITKHEELVSWTSRCLSTTWHHDATLLESLSFIAQMGRRDRFPDSINARDQAEQRKDPIYFLGDSLPLNGPPLGWVFLWHGVYVNFYGQLAPTRLKRWGYVMWDAERWHGLGAEELITKQWKPRSRKVGVLRWTCGWFPLSVEASSDERDGSSTNEDNLSDEEDRFRNEDRSLDE
ncbi:hypothetical protein FHL15_007934 [Xylaria flabelliformis]|uniref:Uncharacterized protein n=1 Tax=Xylaria flabelliformis TaxID=2512241 RepID=A0A553HT63_9PEZI|nr:hypothetical protein FHL15_007934 [Xylaria flabelliformis]